MRYLEITTGPWPNIKEMPWWIRLLSWVFPAANPDLDPFYELVHSWWLEIEDNGLPLREIGFSETGEAIVLAPVERNFGLMIDSSDDWSDSDQDSKEAAENFETVWQSLWPKFEAINQRNKL